MKMAVNVFSMGLLVFLAVAMLALTSVAFALGNEASISIQVLKYEPSPAAPGQYVDLWLNAENSGFQPADKVTIELLPDYPFSLDSSENATRYFGSIGSNGNAQVNYKVRVAAGAIDGWNGMNIRYNVGGGDSWITNNISILVRTPDAVVSIESVKTEPSQMAPGKESVLNVTLKNMAASTLKDVTLKLDLSSVSIYPVGTATESKIYFLQPDEAGSISFRLLAGSSMEAGAYKIPINITYSDYAGTSYLKRDYITVIVGGIPEISAGIEKTEITRAGSSGKVTLNIINKGLTSVKFLQATLNKSSNYEITSPSNQIYVGKLDSDDYQTIEFSVFMKPEAKSPVKFLLELDYKDANNNHFLENKVIEMRLYSADELAMFNLSSGGGLPIWLIAIAVIIIAYLIYRRFFRKQRK